MFSHAHIGLIQMFIGLNTTYLVVLVDGGVLIVRERWQVGRRSVVGRIVAEYREHLGVLAGAIERVRETLREHRMPRAHERRIDRLEHLLRANFIAARFSRMNESTVYWRRVIA